MTTANSRSTVRVPEDISISWLSPECDHGVVTREKQRIQPKQKWSCSIKKLSAHLWFLAVGLFFCFPAPTTTRIWIRADVQQNCSASATCAHAIWHTHTCPLSLTHLLTIRIQCLAGVKPQQPGCTCFYCSAAPLAQLLGSLPSLLCRRDKCIPHHAGRKKHGNYTNTLI